MSSGKTKLNYEELKDHLVKGMNVRIDAGELYLYGEKVDPRILPALILEDLRKLGFINLQRIKMGE